MFPDRGAVIQNQTAVWIERYVPDIRTGIFFDIPDAEAVAGGQEGEGHAVAFGPAGPADAVEVILVLVPGYRS